MSISSYYKERDRLFAEQRMERAILLTHGISASDIDKLHDEDYIALQKSLASDTIPEISNILLEHGIIKTPLTAVIRKGREHYVCQRNLRAHIQFERDRNMERILAELLSPNAIIDLAEIDGLTAHVKRKISVPSRCRTDCPHLIATARIKRNTLRQKTNQQYLTQKR